eukprot:5771966-Prymnesium_polylepis.1
MLNECPARHQLVRLNLAGRTAHLRLERRQLLYHGRTLLLFRAQLRQERLLFAGASCLRLQQCCFDRTCLLLLGPGA